MVISGLRGEDALKPTAHLQNVKTDLVSKKGGYHGGRLLLTQPDRPSCDWATGQVQPVLSCPALSQKSGLWVVCPQAAVRSWLALMVLPPALVLVYSGSGVVFLGGRLPLSLNTHMSIPTSFLSIHYGSVWAVLWAVIVNISRAEQLGNNGQCGGFTVGEPYRDGDSL